MLDRSASEVGTRARGERQQPSRRDRSGRLFPVGTNSPTHAWIGWDQATSEKGLDVCFRWETEDGNIILWMFTKHGMSEQQSTFQVRAETSQVSYATAFLPFCCGHGSKQKSKRTSAGDGEDAKVVAGGGFAGVAESQSHALMPETATARAPHMTGRRAGNNACSAQYSDSFYTTRT